MFGVVAGGANVPEPIEDYVITRYSLRRLIIPERARELADKREALIAMDEL
jgi:hypothetical protein